MIYILNNIDKYLKNNSNVLIPFEYENNVFFCLSCNDIAKKNCEKLHYNRIKTKKMKMNQIYLMDLYNNQNHYYNDCIAFQFIK